HGPTMIDYRSNDGICQHHCRTERPHEDWHTVDELGPRCLAKATTTILVRTRKNPTGYIYEVCNKCLREQIDHIALHIDAGEESHIQIEVPAPLDSRGRLDARHCTVTRIGNRKGGKHGERFHGGRNGR